MKLAYVAGRYRAKTIHGIVENIRAAERVALELWRARFAVICPHKNTGLMDGTLPDETWLAGDLVMLSRCDVLVTVSGWEQSQGATNEVEFAKANGIAVYHWPHDAELLAKVAGA